MALYLLHIEPPYKHAAHYLGYTVRAVEERVAEHLAGIASPLIRAALSAGHSVTLARTWQDGTRADERRLKNWKKSSQLCPCCKESR